MDREQVGWELRKAGEKNAARKKIIKNMGGKQTAPRSKRKTGISSKEGSERGGKGGNTTSWLRIRELQDLRDLQFLGAQT